MNKRNVQFLKGALLIILSAVFFVGCLPATTEPAATGADNLAVPEMTATPSPNYLPAVLGDGAAGEVTLTFDWDSYETAALGSDNWPVTWCDDGYQYTMFADGAGFGGSGGPTSPGYVDMGAARMSGPPWNWTGENLDGGVDPLYGTSFPDGLIGSGGKSIGILCIGNTNYFFRNGDGGGADAYKFSELWKTTDGFENLTKTDVVFTRGAETVDFFSPSFLQTSQGYAVNDGYVYIVAPELVDDSSWIVQKPGRLVMMRVPINQIEQKSAWEYYNGGNSWSTSNYQPILEDATNGVMRTSLQYVDYIKKYVLVTNHIDRGTSPPSALGFYISDNITGPYELLRFDYPFGEEFPQTVFFGVFPTAWNLNGDCEFIFTGRPKPGTNQTPLDSFNKLDCQWAVGGS